MGPRRKEREIGTENLFAEIMAINFPKLEKNEPKETNTKHIIIKM